MPVQLQGRKAGSFHRKAYYVHIVYIIDHTRSTWPTLFKFNLFSKCPQCYHEVRLSLGSVISKRILIFAKKKKKKKKNKKSQTPIQMTTLAVSINFIQLTNET